MNKKTKTEAISLIEVKHLTKRYGSHLAVSDLSFTIQKGVIYGFLGPNGAGKSTTMNIITGCMGATSGEVLIDGHNIMDDPMRAKKCIGYLPEQPPLYLDMTAREYLHFVAKAKGIDHGKRNGQIASAMEKTGIVEMQNRMMKNLSKGYRQRVGIAQALLGDPEVIILDEPTVGLDPAQIIEIRELIRELGKKHTIVLSSHILSEVQAVCNSIMIISKGKLVAGDTPENLMRLFSGATTLHIETRADMKTTQDVLSTMEGVEDFKLSEGKNGVTLADIHPAEGADISEALSRAFVKIDRPLRALSMEKASLEDVFLELTQTDENRGEGESA